MGFLYEALKYLREYLMCKHQACSGRPENQNLLHSSNAQASSTSNQEETRSKLPNSIKMTKPHFYNFFLTYRYDFKKLVNYFSSSTVYDVQKRCMQPFSPFANLSSFPSNWIGYD